MTIEELFRFIQENEVDRTAQLRVNIAHRPPFVPWSFTLAIEQASDVAVILTTTPIYDMAA